MIKATLFSDDKRLIALISSVFELSDTNASIFLYDDSFSRSQAPLEPSILFAEDPENIDTSGFSYVIKKPFTGATAAKAASILLSGDEQMISPEEKASLILDTLGASKKLKGYKLVSYAVPHAARCLRERKAPVLLDIYSAVSAEAGGNPGSTERAIRTFVESVFRSGDINGLFELFGNTPDPEKGKCTNAEFIFRLAEKYNSLYHQD